MCDASETGGALWSGKYGIRRTLADKSGNPGNSCIHLTDEQTAPVLARGSMQARGGGMACDSSYAFSCAAAGQADVVREA